MVKFTPFTAIHKFFGIPVPNKNKKVYSKNENKVKINRSDGKINVKSKVYLRQKSTIGYEKVTTPSQTENIKDYSFETILNKKYSHDKNESKIFPGTSNREDSFRQQNSCARSHDSHYLASDSNQGVSNPSKINQATNNPQIYAVYRTVSDLREELQRKCLHSAGINDCDKCYCEHCGAMTVVQESLKHPLMFEAKDNLRVSDELRKKYHKRYKRLKTVTEDPAFVNLLEKYNKLENKVTELEENIIIRESRNTAIRLMYDMYTQSSASTIDAADTMPKPSSAKAYSPRKADSKYLCLPKHLFRSKSTTPKYNSKPVMTKGTSPMSMYQPGMSQMPRSIIKNKPPTPLDMTPKLPSLISKTEYSNEIDTIQAPSPIPTQLAKPVNNQLCPMPRKPALSLCPPKLRSQSYVNNKNTNESKTNNKDDTKMHSHLAEIRSKYKCQSSNDSKDNLIKLNTPEEQNSKVYARNNLDSRKTKSFVRKHFENSLDSISSYASSINASSARTRTLIVDSNRTTKKIGSPTLKEINSFDRQLENKSPVSSRASSRDTSPEKRDIKSKILDLIIADYKNSKIPININTHGKAVRKEVSQMLETYGFDDLNIMAKTLARAKEKSQEEDVSVVESVVRIENYQDINDKTPTESEAESNDFKKKFVKKNPLQKLKKKIPLPVMVKSKPEPPIPKPLDRYIESWSILPDITPQLIKLKSVSIISDKLDTSELSFQNHDSKISKLPPKLEMRNRISNASDKKIDRSINSIFSRKVTPIINKRDLNISKTTTDSNGYEMSSIMLDSPKTVPTRKIISNVAKQARNMSKQSSKSSEVESRTPKSAISVKNYTKIPMRLVTPTPKSRQSSPPISITPKHSGSSLLNRFSTEYKKKVVTQPSVRNHKLNYTEIGKKKESLIKPPASMSNSRGNSQVMKPWMATNGGSGFLSNSIKSSVGTLQMQEMKSFSDISTFSLNETMRFLNNRMSLLEETAEEMKRLSTDYN